MNDIGPEGAKHFAAALLKNKTLQTLRLDSTKIGFQGAMAIADVLASKPCALRELFILRKCKLS